MQLLSWAPWASVPHASGPRLPSAPRYCALLRLPSSFPVDSLLAPFHLPRSQTPVVSRPLALSRTGLLPSRHCMLSALGPLAQTYPLTTTVHFSEFDYTACALAFPSASHTASRRSHFGSATGPVASLSPGGINRLTPAHPLGSIDVFQGVSPGCHPYSDVPIVSRHDQ